MNASIKNKLSLLLIVLILGFGILGYQIVQLTTLAKGTANRLVSLGEVESEIKTFAMEIRGYQLYGKPKSLETYESSYKNIIKRIDALLPILLSQENQVVLIELKNNMEQLHTVNIPRIALITKYGTTVNGEQFAKEHKIEFDLLQSITQESGTLFVAVQKNLETLLKEVHKKNFDRLNTYELLSGFLLIIIAIISLIVYFVIGFSIKRSVLKAKESCEDIRRTKDLRICIETGSKDEINETMQSVNVLLSDINNALSLAKNNAMENASVATELSSTSLQIGQRAEEEAHIVTTTALSAKHVGDEITQASDETQKVEKVILKAQTSLSQAKNLLDQTVQHLNEAEQVETQINDRLSHLSSEAQQVKIVLDVIGEIADQTNLLALNAAIEAARAGEHGRGFAVVADEVRKLAERTQKSLVETNATVNVIVQSIGDISGDMNSNVKRIHKLSSFSTQVTLQTDEAVEMLEESVAVIENVAKIAQVNARLIESDVIQKIESINELSSSNARSVEEIAGAAEHLSKLSETLSHTLSEFKTV